MAEKTAAQLIEERAQSMDEDYGYGSSPRKYNCMSTGLPFMSMGEAAYSPYTGSTEIEEVYAEETTDEQDYMKPTPVPASQADPFKQVPVSPNPVPAGSAPKPGPDAPWDNKPWQPNPAPDASGQLGPDQANSQTGYVTYPQQSVQPGQVPPYSVKQPGERTDKAPGGSK